MIECTLFTKDDYDSILSHLKSARIVCKDIISHNLSGKVNLYLVEEIDRQLEIVETLLKKKGL